MGAYSLYIPNQDITLYIGDTIKIKDEWGNIIVEEFPIGKFEDCNILMNDTSVCKDCEIKMILISSGGMKWCCYHDIVEKLNKYKVITEYII